MLRKTPLVTVVPPIEAQAYRAASYVCITYPPAGTGGDTKPPVNPAPPGSSSPPEGTPIILEVEGPEQNQYTVYTGLAPPPPGFVCRQASIFVTDYNDPTHPATWYSYVCTREL